MGIYLKKFDNHTQYENYINGSGAILPNVSICTTEGDVHYNPYVKPTETRVVATFNVTDTSNPTMIIFSPGYFDSIEIDGVEQPSVVSEYAFDTVGEHTVKYTLTDQTSIGSSAFSRCSSLTSIIIPNSVTYIGQWAFSGCTSLTSIDIPNSVTSIGDGAFNGCTSLTSCTIGSGVTSIGSSAFTYCSSLTSIDMPNSVTSIGNSAFTSCYSLTSVTIGNSVTSIGNYAFHSCSHLTNIDIPNSVTSIGMGAFNGSGLKSCTIGDGVTSIDYSAFYDCRNLTSIVSNASTAPTITASTFRGVKTDGTLTVPSGSSGYDTWMQNTNFYLGLYNWTKVEQ